MGFSKARLKIISKLNEDLNEEVLINLIKNEFLNYLRQGAQYRNEPIVSLIKFSSFLWRGITLASLRSVGKRYCSIDLQYG